MISRLTRHNVLTNSQYIVSYATLEDRLVGGMKLDTSASSATSLLCDLAQVFISLCIFVSSLTFWFSQVSLSSVLARFWPNKQVMPTQRNGCGFLVFSWVLFWLFVCLVGFGFKFNVRTCWFDIILAANILMTRGWAIGSNCSCYLQCSNKPFDFHMKLKKW